MKIVPIVESCLGRFPDQPLCRPAVSAEHYFSTHLSFSCLQWTYFSACITSKKF